MVPAIPAHRGAPSHAVRLCDSDGGGKGEHYTTYVPNKKHL
jgi:hypothetical protein